MAMAMEMEMEMQENADMALQVFFCEIRELRLWVKGKVQSKG